jgi:hypothetical protein
MRKMVPSNWSRRRRLRNTWPLGSMAPQAQESVPIRPCPRTTDTMELYLHSQVTPVHSEVLDVEIRPDRLTVIRSEVLREVGFQ